MAEPTDHDTPQPLTEGDIEIPPANASFEPAAPLKDAGVEFEPATEADATTRTTTTTQIPRSLGEATQLFKDNTAHLRGQAGDKARVYVEDGKAKATDALGQLSQLLSDAADQVDEKLGGQYGQYARNASERVQSFSSTLDAKSVDDLFGEARELVKKSPGVAIGAAAAVGFVVARLLTAGVDQRGA